MCIRDSLYDTGINLARGAQQGGDGLARLVSAAADASMSVGAFADFIAENSRVSVAIGVEAMAGLSDSVRRALIPMGSLALTTSEANEYIGDYLELQRGLGVLDTMSRLEQTQSQTEYLVMLTSLTAITGKRRKQIAQEIQDAMKNTPLTAWMLNMNAEDRAAAEKTTKRLTGFLTAINPQAAQSFTEALGKGDVYLTEWGQDMAAAGFTQEMAAYNQLITQIRNGRVSEEQAEAEMLRIQEMMKANNCLLYTSDAADE